MATYGSTGDPQRSLELLWRTAQRPTRGPKPTLTLDDVIAAGVAVADREGLPALSMRKVAEELRVATMSLYTYVPTKAELIDLMFDAVVGETTADPGPPAASWREAVEGSARAAWELRHRHPW